MLQRIYSLLLVDDEEANRLLLTRRLEQEGFLVTTAEQGRMALEMMRVQRFDLVLLDMNMPVMDGLTTLDAIKSDPLLQETAVMMLTASNNREHVVHCLTLGAADYLIKPVNPVELKQRVRRCLDNKAAPLEATIRVESKDLKGTRVLIVDDEPLNLRLLERRLGQLGFQVLAATGGREALVLLGHETIDAVLLDLNMPDMNGLEVLREIRANKLLSSLPVLMLSAENQEEMVEKCYHLGVNDYLCKPYHTQDLHVRLAVAMEIGRNKVASRQT
jgi:CheY-like chemotaxis protein